MNCKSAGHGEVNQLAPALPGQQTSSTRSVRWDAASKILEQNIKFVMGAGSQLNILALEPVIGWG